MHCPVSLISGVIHEVSLCSFYASDDVQGCFKGSSRGEETVVFLAIKLGVLFSILTKFSGFVYRCILCLVFVVFLHINSPLIFLSKLIPIVTLSYSLNCIRSS